MSSQPPADPRPGAAPAASKRALPSSFYNPLTLLGLAIAGICFGLIIFLLLIEVTSGHQKPYMGIIAFVILPAILLMGLVLMTIGMVRQQYRRRHGKALEARLPRIDLNDPRHRRAVQWGTAATVVVLVLSAFTSFKAYEHTDSDQFCGETCHGVMKPEYTAYQNSPHARVGCVQCHIGPGAKWFVRSKLSGTYQVYATLFKKYPRPIPTPIENLRPSRDTCEQCHWPQHFFAEKYIQNQYYLSDEANSPVKITLAVKIGGGNTEAGPTAGIHWHMNVANEVTYVALDRERTQIPWVRSRSRDGQETIYRSTELPHSESDLAKGERRQMDCIDCHNRPTHIYHPPAQSVNEVMSLGWIDASLPYIKKVAVDALDQRYSTTAGALDSIRTALTDYYQQNYPTVAATKAAEIETAVAQVQRIFSRNFFPEMGVSWRNFRDNIGHLYSIGCFRCHDGKHVTDDGKVLSRECTTCHTILSEQVGAGGQQVSLTGVDYQHPEDIGDAWKDTNCVECHGPQ